MSKICPNCLHPVRNDTNYCGYCGASLVASPRDPAAPLRASTKESGSAVASTPVKAQRLPKNSTPSRAWIKIPITLLILVILLALAVRFWPEILTFINQALTLLKLT